MRSGLFHPLSISVGLRYTRAEKNNRFVPFISLISVLGLTLGVAVLITVLSVMNGFDHELRTRILGSVSQASVFGYEYMETYEPVMEKALANDNVLAAAPFIQMQGMLTANAQVSGAMITGVVPKYEDKVSIVDENFDSGSLDTLTPGSFNMAVGSQMAEALGLSLGDKLTLVLPEASASAAGVIPRFKRFTVSGIFTVSPEVDAAMVYVAMDDAATLLRLPHGAQGIRLKLSDLFLAQRTAYDVALDSPVPVYPTDWTQTHGNLFGAIKMEKAMVGLLLFFIIVVAAFNIVSSLVMAVTDKKADIAILKTMGASDGFIRKVFMVQGLVIGLFGTVVGGLLGVVLALGIGPLFSLINSAFGLGLFDAYFINYLPSRLELGDVVLVCAVTLVLSFLATLYPASRAAKIRPAETLRYE